MKVVLVLRLAQPGLLAALLADPPTFRLGAVALALSVPIIRKKKALAVMAFTAARCGLHRFENQTDHFEENAKRGRRKSAEEKSER